MAVDRGREGAREKQKQTKQDDYKVEIKRREYVKEKMRQIKRKGGGESQRLGAREGNLKRVERLRVRRSMEKLREGKGLGHGDESE